MRFIDIMNFSLCPKDWVRYPMQTETPLKIAQRIIAKMSEVPG